MILIVLNVKATLGKGGHLALIAWDLFFIVSFMGAVSYHTLYK